MAQCQCKFTGNSGFSAALMLVLNDSSSEDGDIFVDADLDRVAVESIVVNETSTYKEDKTTEILTVPFKVEKPSREKSDCKLESKIIRKDKPRE